MEYREFMKKLDVPAGRTVPERLTFDDVVVRALSRADLKEDVRGINASLEIIRRTRGGSWPSDEVTEEFDFVDLVWHEAEFRDGGSYAYAAYDTNERYWVTGSPSSSRSRSRTTPTARYRQTDMADPTTFGAITGLYS